MRTRSRVRSSISSQVRFGARAGRAQVSEDERNQQHILSLHVPVHAHTRFFILRDHYFRPAYALGRTHHRAFVSSPLISDLTFTPLFLYPLQISLPAAVLEHSC